MSIEDQKGFIASVYRGLLHREPDPSGMQNWLLKLPKTGVEGILDTIVSSPEFRTRYLNDRLRDKGTEFARDIANQIVLLSIGKVLHPPRLSLVHEHLPPAVRILDLGGASRSRQGALLEMGYEHAEELTIIDLPNDIRMKPGPDVDHAFHYEDTKITYSYHSMADLQFYPDNAFDLVWSGQTYEHITEREGVNLFPQIARVLKTGGHFAMDTPNRALTEILVGPENFIHAEHKVEYRYDEFVAKFRHKDLRLVSSKGILEMPSTLENGYGVLSDLDSAQVNDFPERSFCFYCLFQKL